MTELNRKQQTFAEEYAKTMNATEAAKRAGYAENSAHVTGCKLLKHPNVQKFLSNYIKARTADTDVTVENIITGVAKIAFSEFGTRDQDKLKALELLGKKFGIWDGISGDNAGRNRETTLGKLLGAIQKHSGCGGEK